jgi:RNA polymerase sigma-70 factor (ECF subfamily)
MVEKAFPPVGGSLTAVLRVVSSASGIITPVSPTADRLLERCRAGDERAWEVVVDRYAAYVHSIAVRAFRLAPADAEDVFQEAFLRTWQNLDRIHDDEALRPWIGQVTRRLCLDRVRRGHEHADTAELEGRGEVDAGLATIEAAIDLRAGLAALTETCRDILDRFFARDQSYATIGEQLAVPAGTVASRISRCLARLREQLEGRT